MFDPQFMKRAVSLAQNGCGHTNPNPMVGAVIVRDGEVIGEGYHAKYGSLHAERAALASCRKSPRGATMYVTLEPCCHHGKQPPCTEAIIESGISHVVIGSKDPNPLVAGKGVQVLKKAGIKVTEEVLIDECDAVNYVFFHHIKTGLPYVVMKYAMTMDGKIATHTGESKWITGETARQKVQEDRNRYMGIMVGIGTVLKDDPLLTCRLAGGRSPIRIVCDTSLQTPIDSQLVRTAHQYDTIIATCCTSSGKHAPYIEQGCRIITVPDLSGHIDLRALMKTLGAQKIDSILLEGGGILNWAALQAGIVNRVQAYISPKLFGGANSPTPVRGEGVEFPADAFMLRKPIITYYGDDILLESEVISCSPES